MSQKYHLENGTSMPLEYQCVGEKDVFTGVIPASSAQHRLIRGINPSFTACAQSPALTCTLRPIDGFAAPEAPPAVFVMNPRKQNHVTLQCPYPFQDICNPSEVIFSGKLLPNTCGCESE